MAENKGRIDVALGQRFLADHFDTYDKKVEPDERTLCGHIDLSARGSKPWQPPYRHRAAQCENKVADAAMAAQMSLQRRDGPLLRDPLQVREIPESASRIRLGKGRAPKPRFPPVDRLQNRETVTRHGVYWIDESSVMRSLVESSTFLSMRSLRPSIIEK